MSSTSIGQQVANSVAPPPVILVSAATFNALGVQLVAPITHGGHFARHRGFAVELTNTQTTGVILCNQLRTVDIAARNGRWVESKHPVRAAA